MKENLIFIFFISLFVGISFHTQAQQRVETVSDSVYFNEKYGLRLGLDLSKPFRTIINKPYKGYGIVGDFRLTKNLYIAGELGIEELEYGENLFEAKSSGNYIKAGANYNVYDNWIGMQNEIYVGLRYGFATFSETLYEYTIYDLDHYFPPDYREVNQKFSNLNAHWIEFQLGIKTEVLNNLYLGIHAELKYLLTGKTPDNFDNLWMPGFQKNYETNAFGMGWGYSISYLIPIHKKKIAEKVN